MVPRSWLVEILSDNICLASVVYSVGRYKNGENTTYNNKFRANIMSCRCRNTEKQKDTESCGDENGTGYACGRRKCCFHGTVAIVSSVRCIVLSYRMCNNDRAVPRPQRFCVRLLRIRPAGPRKSIDSCAVHGR